MFLTLFLRATRFFRNANYPTLEMVKVTLFCVVEHVFEENIGRIEHFFVFSLVVSRNLLILQNKFKKTIIQYVALR